MDTDFWVDSSANLWWLNHFWLSMRCCRSWHADLFYLCEQKTCQSATILISVTLLSITFRIFSCYICAGSHSWTSCKFFLGSICNYRSCSNFSYLLCCLTRCISSPSLTIFKTSAFRSIPNLLKDSELLSDSGSELTYESDEEQLILQWYKCKPDVDYYNWNPEGLSLMLTQDY
jgi:hypothetical protein